MKKYFVIVSRYQSVGLTIEADSIEMAEFIAEREVGDGGFFYDSDDEIEIVDSYEDEAAPFANITQEDSDLVEFNIKSGILPTSNENVNS